MRASHLIAAVLLGISQKRSCGSNEAYGYVPASPASRILGTLEIPRSASEGDVVLLGDAAARPAPHPVHAPVIAFGITDPGEAAPPSSTPSGVPAGTLWPDPEGRIGVPGPEVRSVGQAQPPNPFVPRGRHRPAPLEAVFACEGVIVGGDRGPVAFVNGRAVRTGDLLGSFRVRCVVREGVVVEALGSLAILPVARTARLILPSP